MMIYLKDISINSILRAKLSNNGIVNDHLRLIYPQAMQDGSMLYTAEIDVCNNDFSISNKREGAKEYVIIDIHSVGSIQIESTDFSSIIMY